MGTKEWRKKGDRSADFQTDASAPQEVQNMNH